MVVRARDIERQRQYNRLARFVDPSASGTSYELIYGQQIRLVHRDLREGKQILLESFEDAIAADKDIALSFSNLDQPAQDFAQSLETRDKLTLKFASGEITCTLKGSGSTYWSIRVQDVTSDDSGPIGEGDAVVVSIGETGGKSLTAWYRVDDSTIRDAAEYLRFGNESVQTGTDTRRVLFIRTRDNRDITTDQLCVIAGLRYEVRSIQELANKRELRIALVRLSD